MTYIPTGWVDFNLPCIDAANLNNMEHGIDIAQGDVMVLRGLLAGRPASVAELVGRLYFATDTSELFRDNGAGWDQIVFDHDDLAGVSADDHHAGFIALEDNAGVAVPPAADDRVQLTDDGVVNADAVGNTIALSVTQAQIDHGSIGGLADDDHTQYLKERASGGLGTETPVHTHVAGQGGQLDWDDVWADAVHDHSAAGEGGTVNHASLGVVTADQHHAGFIALEDNAAAVIPPAADDRIQVTDDGVVNADAVGNTLALSIAQAQIDHDSIGGVSTDDHHTGFIGLEDNAAVAVVPAADDRIQFTDDGVVNADAVGNTIALSVAQAQIDHGTIGGLADDDHPQYIKDSEFAALGDLLRGTGAGTFNNLAIGGAGQVLTVAAGTASWAAAAGAGLAPTSYWGKNLIKNSPGQIVTDGAEPQWWDDVANATITDEDTVGEGIADIHERVFKVVTIANDVYGYQTLTFADEELLDAGQTVISLGCWVYCANANKASIAINGTNLGLQESAQVPAATWTWLEVENQTLHAADAAIEVRLIVDTGTAYFTMPMLAPGPESQPWKPRGEKYIPTARTDQISVNGGTDVAWSDTDCTANTDPLAVGIGVHLYAREIDGVMGSYIGAYHDTALTGADAAGLLCYVQVATIGASHTTDNIRCDDSQVIRYIVEEQDNDNDVSYRLRIIGYWMWK